MKFDKLMGTFVLEFVLVATLVTLAAIAVQAQAKPKEDQPDVLRSSTERLPVGANPTGVQTSFVGSV
jgi:hypothetical protein